MWQNSQGRRQFLELSAKLMAMGVLSPTLSAVAKPANASKDKQYRIAVCDWMILKRQKPGAFELAKTLGADGVEVDMGGLGNRETFDSKLSDPIIRAQFLAKAKEFDVEISSIAMSGFYAQSFAERPGVERMVQDCLDTMKHMNVKIAFLPLGVKGDLVQYPHLRPAVIERLKQIAPRAAAAGVIIGIETALDAREEAKLLDEIGSRSVQSYFNFANPLQQGRDIYEELRILGRDRICQIHCTDEDGVWLQNNKRLDLTKIKAVLDKMNWRGWLVAERSRDAKDPRNTVWNFSANVAYLKSVFQG